LPVTETRTRQSSGSRNAYERAMALRSSGMPEQTRADNVAGKLGRLADVLEAKPASQVAVSEALDELLRAHGANV
jgi:hypothetical protein